MMRPSVAASMSSKMFFTFSVVYFALCISLMASVANSSNIEEAEVQLAIEEICCIDDLNTAIVKKADEEANNHNLFLRNGHADIPKIDIEYLANRIAESCDMSVEGARDIIYCVINKNCGGASGGRRQLQDPITTLPSPITTLSPINTTNITDLDNGEIIKDIIDVVATLNFTASNIENTVIKFVTLFNEIQVAVDLANNITNLASVSQLVEAVGNVSSTINDMQKAATLARLFVQLARNIDPVEIVKGVTNATSGINATSVLNNTTRPSVVDKLPAPLGFVANIVLAIIGIPAKLFGRLGRN